MAPSRTVSLSTSNEQRIPTLRVEVLEGPDAGVRCATKSETLTIGTASSNELVLSDETVSRFHVDLEVAGNNVGVSDNASTNGTICSGVRLTRGFVAQGAVLQLGRTKVKVGAGEEVAVALSADAQVAGIVSNDPRMRRMMARLERAAKSDATVLLLGESGTGKEVSARAIHDLSKRSAGPFVTVDCGSLSPNLVASELFGHEKGAFTGADRQRRGAFEAAHGGTVFLDEVGELPAELQPVLLGVLERRSFRRVGGREEIDVDVRVVSATHRDLRSEVNSGAFRLDLYYRLAVVALTLPPLRERIDDIEPLLTHFLRAGGEALSVDELVSADMFAMMRRHSWPGNVRELRNVLDSILAMGDAPQLEEAAAHGVSGHAGGDRDSLFGDVLMMSYKDARGSVVSEFERAYLGALLERCDDNVSKAARVALMDRSHLTDMLRRHGLR